MVFSPLEQFEPVSFISVFLFDVNLSITNISVMFIFMIFIVGFILNGSLFTFRKSTSFSIDADRSIVLNSSDMLSSYKGPSSVTAITFFNNFSNSIEKHLDFLIFKYNKMGFKVMYNELLLTYYSLSFMALKKTVKGLCYNTFSGTFLNTVKNSSNLFNVLGSNKKSGFIKPLFVSSVFVYIFEFLYSFILDQVKNVVNGDVKLSVKFFPLTFFIFVFILLSNLLGMIPYSSTVTAYIIITLTLAVMVNLGVTIYALSRHKLHWFSFFLPEGVPVIL
jgi:hypothetical protein